MISLFNEENTNNQFVYSMKAILNQHEFYNNSKEENNFERSIIEHNIVFVVTHFKNSIIFQI